MHTTQSLSKFQWYFEQKWEKLSKICMEPQKTLKSQSNLEKEQSLRHHIYWFQTYHKPIIIKIV